MKKLAMSVGALWLAGSLTAMAGGLGAYGSYWSTKDADAGFGGGGKLQFMLGDIIGLEIRGSYFPDLNEEESLFKYELEVIPAEADLILAIPLGDLLRVYGGGGAGYYFIDAKIKGQGLDEKVNVDDQLGWFAVGGLQVQLTEAFALFGEGKYTGIKAKFKGDDVEEITDDVDMHLDGFGANVGLLLTW